MTGPITILVFALMIPTALGHQPVPSQKLYVANSAGNDLHIIDAATNKVIKRVEVGPQPHGLVATKDGKQLFLTIENITGEEGELIWFDPVTDTVTRRMKTESSATSPSASAIPSRSLTPRQGKPWRGSRWARHRSGCWW